MEEEETPIKGGILILLFLVAALCLGAGFYIGQNYSGQISDEQIFRNAEFMLYNSTSHYVVWMRSMIPQQSLATYESYKMAGTAQTMVKSQLHEMCKTVMTK